MPQHTAPTIPTELNVRDRLAFINEAQDFFPADVTAVAPPLGLDNARTVGFRGPQNIPEDFLPAIEQEQPFSPFDAPAGPTEFAGLGDIFAELEGLPESDSIVREFAASNRARTKRIQEILRDATKGEKKGLGEKIAPFAELAGLIIDATSRNPFVRGRAGAQAVATREARVGRRARRRAGRLQTAQQLVAAEQTGAQTDLANLNAILQGQKTTAANIRARVGAKADVVRAGQRSAKDVIAGAEFKELQTAKQWQDALNEGKISADEIPPRVRDIMREKLGQDVLSSRETIDRTRKELVEFWKDERKNLREDVINEGFEGNVSREVAMRFNRFIDEQMQELLGFDLGGQSIDDIIGQLQGGAPQIGGEQQFEGVDPDVAEFLQAGGR